MVSEDGTGARPSTDASRVKFYNNVKVPRQADGTYRYNGVDFPSSMLDSEPDSSEVADEEVKEEADVSTQPKKAKVNVSDLAGCKVHEFGHVVAVNGPNRWILGHLVVGDHDALEGSSTNGAGEIFDDDGLIVGLARGVKVELAAEDVAEMIFPPIATLKGAKADLSGRATDENGRHVGGLITVSDATSSWIDKPIDENGEILDENNELVARFAVVPQGPLPETEGSGAAVANDSHGEDHFAASGGDTNPNPEESQAVAELIREVYEDGNSASAGEDAAEQSNHDQSRASGESPSVSSSEKRESSDAPSDTNNAHRHGGKHPKKGQQGGKGPMKALFGNLATKQPSDFQVSRIIGLIEDCLHELYQKTAEMDDAAYRYLTDDLLRLLVVENLFPNPSGALLNHGWFQPMMFPKWPFVTQAILAHGYMKPIVGPDMSEIEFHYQILYDLIYWLRKAWDIERSAGPPGLDIGNPRWSAEAPDWTLPDLETLGQEVLAKIHFNNEAYMQIELAHYQTGENTASQPRSSPDHGGSGSGDGGPEDDGSGHGYDGPSGRGGAYAPGNSRGNSKDPDGGGDDGGNSDDDDGNDPRSQPRGGAKVQRATANATVKKSQSKKKVLSQDQADTSIKSSPEAAAATPKARKRSASASKPAAGGGNITKKAKPKKPFVEMSRDELAAEWKARAWPINRIDFCIPMLLHRLQVEAALAANQQPPPSPEIGPHNMSMPILRRYLIDAKKLANEKAAKGMKKPKLLEMVLADYRAKKKPIPPKETRTLKRNRKESESPDEDDDNDDNDDDSGNPSNKKKKQKLATNQRSTRARSAEASRGSSENDNGSDQQRPIQQSTLRLTRGRAVLTTATSDEEEEEVPRRNPIARTAVDYNEDSPDEDPEEVAAKEKKRKIARAAKATAASKDKTVKAGRKAGNKRSANEANLQDDDADSDGDKLKKKSKTSKSGTRNANSDANADADTTSLDDTPVADATAPRATRAWSRQRSELPQKVYSSIEEPDVSLIQEEEEAEH